VKYFKPLIEEFVCCQHENSLSYAAAGLSNLKNHVVNVVSIQGSMNWTSRFISGNAVVLARNKLSGSSIIGRALAYR
jgi:hypothetical protein